MALITVNANLQLIAPGATFNGVWVRLVSDFDGSSYVSSAVSDSLGNFTAPGVVLGPSSSGTPGQVVGPMYQVQISNPAAGGSSSGPWTTVQQNYMPGQNPIGTFLVNLTPAATAASIGMSEQTFALNGLNTSDVVIVNPPAAPAALVSLVAARVSALNTLALTFANLTAAANTPVAGNHRVAIIRT